MRIPHIITQNVRITYEIPDIYLRKEHIKIDDFSWNNDFFTTLRELSLKVIVAHWKKYPLYDKITVKADKLQLLELLATDLPLELTVPIINEDYYWERCFKDHYPDSPDPNRKIKYEKRFRNPSELNINILQDSKTKKSIIREKSITISDKDANVFSFCGNISDDTSSFSAIAPYIEPVPQKFPVPITIMKTWKQIYLQRLMEDEIETMKPETFNAEFVQYLTDLYGEYILSLNLKQLRTCRKKGSSEHISLYTLISKLPTLVELSVCFSQANLGDEFGWKTTLVSEADCDLLGKGVQKSKLHVLRVLRSNIDCNRVTLIIRSLCNHQTLHTLDFSHCKIGDDGAKAIAGMLKSNTVLEKIILVNNRIGPDGVQGLCYYLCQPECNILELDLKLNPIQYLGGKYISTALTRGATSLRSLNLSCCGLTPGNLYLGLALSMNTTLRKFDLSNNNLGDECVKNFLYAMQNNTTLIHLDLRMCGMAPESVQTIQKFIRQNLEAYRGVLTTSPTAENVL